MADMVVRLHYAGETRPVELKQTVWKGSAAHPELDGAKNGTEEAMVKQVDVHSTHGGATTTTAMFWWLRWTKWSINQAQSTTASWRS